MPIARALYCVSVISIPAPSAVLTTHATPLHAEFVHAQCRGDALLQLTSWSENLLPWPPGGGEPAAERAKCPAPRKMTEEKLALSELLEKAGDGDFLRTVAEAVLPLLMEANVEC